MQHLYRWLVAEGEIEADPCEGIHSPAPAEARDPGGLPTTTCAACSTAAPAETSARRDRAIILLFVDGGLRLAEPAGLTTDDMDVRDRMVYVVGKGSGRPGPRKRAVPLGITAARPSTAACAIGVATRGRRTRRCGSATAVAAR